MSNGTIISVYKMSMLYSLVSKQHFGLNSFIIPVGILKIKKHRKDAI